MISPSESSLHGGGSPVLSVASAGHALHVFVNGQLSGDTQSFPSLLMEASSIPIDIM